MDGQPISETVLNQDVLSSLPSVLGKCIDRSAADPTMQATVLESNRTYARDQVIAALIAEKDVVEAQNKILATTTKSPLQSMLVSPFPRVDFLLEGITGEAGLAHLLTSQQHIAGTAEQVHARGTLNEVLAKSIGTPNPSEQMKKMQPVVRQVLAAVLSSYDVNLADPAVIGFLNTATDRFFAHTTQTHELATGFLRGVVADLGKPAFMEKINAQFSPKTVNPTPRAGFSIHNRLKRS